jgi:hypothetical protein
MAGRTELQDIARDAPGVLKVFEKPLPQPIFQKYSTLAGFFDLPFNPASVDFLFLKNGLRQHFSTASTRPGHPT